MRLGAALADSLDGPVAPGMPGSRIATAAPGTPAPGAQVWLASYVDQQTTQVRAGENRGATLRHDHVVRQLWGPWPLGAVPLAQVTGLVAPTAPWGVLAFVQAADGRVLQSLDLPAAACAASNG